MVAKTVGAISRLIREQNLAPGDKLPAEATLARELAVSRTVVREAFRALAAVRIIELGAGRRATIAPIDHGALSLVIEHGVHTDQIGIHEIYDVRRTIETRIVALAALRRSEEEARLVGEEAAAMRANLEAPEELMRHDLAFHRAVARASKNALFALLIGGLQGVMAETWPIGWRSRTTAAAREAMIANHEAIAAAIRDGDPERAVAAMAAHFEESTRALLAAGLI